MYKLFAKKAVMNEVVKNEGVTRKSTLMSGLARTGGLAQIAAVLVSVVALSEAAAAGKDVIYKSGGAEYQGYFTSAGKNAPVVVLIHDWDGLTDYEKKRASMLTEQGYSVFAIDLFGKGVRPVKQEDKMQHTGELYKDRQKLRNLLAAGVAAAKEQGANTSNAAVMGYCFGGAAALELARSGADLKGYITVHGGLGTPEGQDYTKAKGRYLIQHGAADTHITMENVASLSNELEKAKMNFAVEVYGGAPHGWTVYDGEAYRKDADEQSWQSQLRFLAATLSPTPAPVSTK